MNKNIIIAVLVCIIVVLGYVTFNGNVDLQQANTIKTQGVDLSVVSEQLSEFSKKDGGTIEKITEEELDEMMQSSGRMGVPVSTTGANQRPYKCYIALSNGGVYIYDYNSLWDQGNVWNIASGWKCFARDL